MLNLLTITPLRIFETKNRNTVVLVVKKVRNGTLTMFLPHIICQCVRVVPVVTRVGKRGREVVPQVLSS